MAVGQFTPNLPTSSYQCEIDDEGPCNTHPRSATSPGSDFCQSRIEHSTCSKVILDRSCCSRCLHEQQDTKVKSEEHRSMEASLLEPNTVRIESGWKCVVEEKLWNCGTIGYKIGNWVLGPLVCAMKTTQMLLDKR
jgi:hypothetical protein